MNVLAKEIADLLVHPGFPNHPLPPDDRFNRKWVNRVRPEDWKNPTPAKIYNLVVIGAGTAGIVAATRAAHFGAKVALIEKSFLGGICLNVGCIPSKALGRAARHCADIRHSAALGIRGNLKLEDFQVDFGGVMERMRRIRSQVAGNISTERFSDLGIDLFFGEAQFSDENTIRVGSSTLRFKKALIATGSRPRHPKIEGLNETNFMTHETVFNLTTLPKRLMVVGGGPLGCELAQAFQRFGSNVTIVQRTPLFLPFEERDAAQLLAESFARDKMEVRLNTTVDKIMNKDGHKTIHLRNQNRLEEIPFDDILTGIGRSPNIEGLNLEAAGVHCDLDHGIKVDDRLRTTNSNVFAAGDVCSEYQFTHTAIAAAKIVVHNALFLGKKKFSDLAIPWCTYTDPEIAHIGVYVRQARAKGLPIKSYTIPMHQVDRAVIDGEDRGFVKIHVREGTDKILGATIVARHAGEMINEISLAMVAGLRLREIEKVIHSYPTQAEAIHKAADACDRARLQPLKEKLIQTWLKFSR
jgi:pyruvate/2-oxoglutarate dehydrogenase complex dihydrolipoamide dehydrogenase (E3) component